MCLCAMLDILGTVFEGGEVEAYFKMDKKDYPRDPKTQELTAAIHPQLQVLYPLV